MFYCATKFGVRGVVSLLSLKDAANRAALTTTKTGLSVHVHINATLMISSGRLMTRSMWCFTQIP